MTSIKEALRALKRRLIPEYVNGLLKRELQGMQSVLDMGCGGDNSRLRFVPEVPLKVGVDAFQPSVDKARAAGIHDRYLVMPLDKLDIPDKSYDAVIALDLVEHFHKEESRALLKTMERLARRKVVVFTPNGFLPQPSYDGNPWQEHLCGWSVEEFRKLGYRVEGVLGHKKLRGMYYLPKIRPYVLGDQVAAMSRFLWTGSRPESDAALWAVKELEA